MFLAGCVCICLLVKCFLCSQVTILITDVNDSPPLFQFKNYQAEVEENSSSGTKVAVLEAYDPDEEVAAEVKETRTQVGRLVACRVFNLFQAQTRIAYRRILPILDHHIGDNFFR